MGGGTTGGFWWCPGVQPDGARKDLYGNTTLYDGCEKYRDAYRHIVQLFDSVGVTNARWVFQTESWDPYWSGTEHIRMRWLYPGDEFIDVLGFSIYAHDSARVGLSGVWPYRDYGRIDSAYIQLSRLSPDKPIMFCELGALTQGRTDVLPWTLGTWSDSMFTHLVQGRYPRMVAVCTWGGSWTGNQTPGGYNIWGDSSMCRSWRYWLNQPNFACESWTAGTNVGWYPENSGSGNVNVDWQWRSGTAWTSWTRVLSNTPNDGQEAIWPDTSSGAWGPYGRYRISDATTSTAVDHSGGLGVRAPSDMLIYPNGGADINPCSPCTIRWRQLGGSNSTVNIDLITTGFGTTRLATGVANTGSWNWTIGVQWINTNSYKIKISNVDYPVLYDESDVAFRIQDLWDLSAGGVWHECFSGFRDTLRWDSYGVDSVTVRGYLEITGIWVTIADHIPNQGWCTWVPPTNLGGISQNLRLYLQSTACNVPWDSNAITLTDFGGTMQLLAPNGGQTYDLGNTVTVSWTSDLDDIAGDLVRLEVNWNYPNGAWEMIADSLTADGSYDWIILHGDQITTIRVRAHGVWAKGVSDTSNSNFAMTTPAWTDYTIADGDSVVMYAPCTVTDWINIESNATLVIKPYPGVTDARVRFTGTSGMGLWICAGAPLRQARLFVDGTADHPLILDASGCASDNVLIFNPSGQVRMRHVVMTGSGIMGMDIERTTGECPPLLQADSCTLSGFDNGITFWNNDSASYVHHCTFENLSTVNSDYWALGWNTAMAVIEGGWADIADCSIRDCAGIGIWATLSNSSRPATVHLSRTTIENCGAYGVFAQDGSTFAIACSEFLENGDTLPRSGPPAVRSI